MTDLKPSACVLLFNDKGQVLAVPRKKDPSQCGLPGGKVDPGETLFATAIREALEETGLEVYNLKRIHAADDGYGYHATCFLAEWKGTINPGAGETTPFWTDWETLFTKSPFGGYNRQVQIAWRQHIERSKRNC